MKKTIIFILGGVAILQMLALYAYQVASAYSEAGCDSVTPGYASCIGRGSSNCSDALGNLLNENEAYTFVQISSVPNITFIYETNYDWQAGVNADLRLLGTVAFVVRVKSQLYLGSIVGCSVLIRIENKDIIIDGLIYLTQAYVYTAVNLFDSSYGLQCNVFPVSRIIKLPFQQLAVGTCFKIKLSGLRTFVAFGKGTSNLASTAQNNIVSVSVSVTQQNSNQRINVQQQNINNSIRCDVISQNVNSLQNIIMSRISDGDKICDIVTLLGQLVSSVNTQLLDVLKIVIGSKTGSIFIISIGYAPNFIAEDFMDALFQACKSTAD